MIHEVVQRYPLNIGWGISVSVNRETATLRGIPVPSEDLNIYDGIDIEKQIYWIKSTKSYTYQLLDSIQYQMIVEKLTDYFKDLDQEMYEVEYDTSESEDEIKIDKKDKFKQFILKYTPESILRLLNIHYNRDGITVYNIPYSSRELGLDKHISCYDRETQCYTYYNMDKDTYIAVLDAFRNYMDDVNEVEISSYDEQDSDYSEDDSDSDYGGDDSDGYDGDDSES